MFVDELVKKYNFIMQKKTTIEICKAQISNKSVIIIKPQTYMNNSGFPVNEIVNFYKIKKDNIFVFYDDIDTVVGKVKYKFGGSDGGHNGIRSLNSHIGKEYHKIKIGVDRPKNSQPVADYVLNDFRKEEKIEIEIIIYDLIDKIENILDNQSI